MGLGEPEKKMTLGETPPKKEIYDRPMPEWLSRLLTRHPSLSRHPHPMIAHFVIVFMLAATFFNLLYLATGIRSLEIAAFHFLAGGVLSVPAAIASGFFTRWVNFPDLKGDGTIGRERRLSWILLIVSAAALGMRWLEPEILADLKGPGLIYLGLTLAVTPLVTIISFFGGMLTYPLEKE